jgi:ABC-type multidrug transport system fused ATPase/permease subunit
LELIAVALVGAVGALTATSISGGVPGDRVSRLLQIIGADESTIPNQAAFLALIAASLLVGKTVASAIVNRRILFYFADRSSQLSSLLISKMLNGKYAEIKLQDSHTTLYAVTGGVQAMSIGVIANAVNLISDMSLLIILLFGLFVVQPSMAITTLVIFSTTAYLLWRLMHKKTVRLSQEITIEAIKNNQTIFEMLELLKEVYIRNRRFFYSKKIQMQHTSLARKSAELTFLPSLTKYALDIVVVLAIVALASVQFITSESARAVGNLSIFFASAFRIAPAVLRVQQGLLGVKSSWVTSLQTRNLLEVFSKNESVNSLDNYVDTNYDGFVPKIEMEEVEFKYPKSDKAVLADVSLLVEEGTINGITGPSGSGKSTLFDVILGLQEPQSGLVQISNRKPREIIEHYPGALSYVPQDSFIVNGSIKDNLTVGFDPDFWPDEMLWEALERAQLASLVKELPERLNQQVGERGSNLSGGQRQRLCLARALITKPKLILLDESTSSLDNETENSVIDALVNLRGEITVLMIAHRLQTLVECDQIFYLDNARLLATGSFDEVRKQVPAFERQLKLMNLY